MSPSALARLGRVLVAAGIVTIVVAVLVVLEAANGPGTGPKAFAARRSYDQVKVEVHRTFPYALIAGVAGLALAIGGARLARRGVGGASASA